MVDNTFMSKIDLVRSIRIILSESYKLGDFGFSMATISKVKAITLLLRVFGIYEMTERLDMPVFDDVVLHKIDIISDKTIPAIKKSSHLHNKSAFDIVEIVCQTICAYPDDSDMLNNIEMYLSDIFKL